MSGKWTKLTVVGRQKDLDSISAAMSMLDNGLMIEDYSDFTLNGMYGDLVDDSILNADKDTVKVSIFVPEEKNLLAYREFISDRLNELDIAADITLEGMKEEDWSQSWKQYYKPIPLGKVTIVPQWEKYEARDGEIIIRMDPGMAFGTGTHETTRLVMLMLEDEIKGGEHVLDVGTGSGILAICASKLGAKTVNAYDIDPVAVKVARDNVETDGCQGVEVGVSDLLKGVSLDRGKYDVCVANIVADIIIRMLPDLKPYLKDDARVILSGIIGERAEEVRESIYNNGFKIIREESENDWVAIMAAPI